MVAATVAKSAAHSASAAAADARRAADDATGPAQMVAAHAATIAARAATAAIEASSSPALAAAIATATSFQAARGASRAVHIMEALLSASVKKKPSFDDFSADLIVIGREKDLFEVDTRRPTTSSRPKLALPHTKKHSAVTLKRPGGWEQQMVQSWLAFPSPAKSPPQSNLQCTTSVPEFRRPDPSEQPSDVLPWILQTYTPSFFLDPEDHENDRHHARKSSSSSVLSRTGREQVRRKKQPNPLLSRMAHSMPIANSMQSNHSIGHSTFRMCLQPRVHTAPANRPRHRSTNQHRDSRRTSTTIPPFLLPAL